MSQLANVVIVMSRCNQHKESFGIRLEEKARGIWSADWAFPVQERMAKKEGYDQTVIHGEICLDPTYPGCPYCKQESFTYCGKCNKVSCLNANKNIMTCPWCGTNNRLEGRIKELRGGVDL